MRIKSRLSVEMVAIFTSLAIARPTGVPVCVCECLYSPTSFVPMAKKNESLVFNTASSFIFCSNFHFVCVWFCTLIDETRYLLHEQHRNKENRDNTMIDSVYIGTEHEFMSPRHSIPMQFNCIAVDGIDKAICNGSWRREDEPKNHLHGNVRIEKSTAIFPAKVTRFGGDLVKQPKQSNNPWTTTTQYTHIHTHKLASNALGCDCIFAQLIINH